jgi:membrane associated rhomboid family serine protease
VKNLLIINALFFLAKMVLGKDDLAVFNPNAGYKLDHWFSLYWPGSPHFRPWQLVTHMFMHGDGWHLFSNMFGLFMFGSSLEFLWGGRRFLFYYMICGLGAATLHLGTEWFEIKRIESTAQADHVLIEDVIDANLMAHSDAFAAEQELKEAVPSEAAVPSALELFWAYERPMLGASGAIFGILLAFGMMFPNEIIFVPGLFLPLPAKYMVIIYGGLEFYRGFSGAGDGIAHFAHLGGMLVGIFLILHWKKKLIL